MNSIVIAASIAVLLSFCYKQKLPYPYEQFIIEEMPLIYKEIIDHIPLTAMATLRDAAVESNRIDMITLDKNSVTQLFHGMVVGAESVAVSSRGNVTKLTMLDKFGFVRKANYNNDVSKFELTNESVYIGPGRPLGYHLYLSDSAVVVCDSLKGLILVDVSERDVGSSDGDRIRILSNSVSHLGDDKNHIVNYPNDLDISRDGKMIYFSSSTAQGVVGYDSKIGYYDTMRSFLLTWCAGDVSGRLFSYNIDTRETTVLLDKLYYANGVAIAHDESYLLIVETLGLRVLKYHLKGEKIGEVEVFIDNLPGFPDGITKSYDGNSFLISLVSPLSPFLKLSTSKVGRWFIAWATLGPMKELFSKLIKKFGCVLRVSAVNATLERIYLDESGEHVSTVSAVQEDSKGRLFFGNLGGDYVSFYTPSP